MGQSFLIKRYMQCEPQLTTVMVGSVTSRLLACNFHNSEGLITCVAL